MAGIADLISKTGKTTPSRAPSMAMMMAGKPRNPAADKYLQSKQGSTKTPDPQTMQIMQQRLRQQMAAPQRPMGPSGPTYTTGQEVFQPGGRFYDPRVGAPGQSQWQPSPQQPSGFGIDAMQARYNARHQPPPQLNWQQRLAQMAGPQGGGGGKGGQPQQAGYGPSQFNPMMQQRPQLNTMQRYMQAGGKGGSGQPAPGKGGAAGGKGGQAPQRGGHSAGPGRYGRVR